MAGPKEKEQNPPPSGGAPPQTTEAGGATQGDGHDESKDPVGQKNEEQGAPGTKAHTDAGGTYPDVDQPETRADLVSPPHRWEDPDAMIAEIEKHLRESHGLEPDKALLREIVEFVKQYVAKI